MIATAVSHISMSVSHFYDDMQVPVAAKEDADGYSYVPPSDQIQTGPPLNSQA